MNTTGSQSRHDDSFRRQRRRTWLQWFRWVLLLALVRYVAHVWQALALLVTAEYYQQDNQDPIVVPVVTVQSDSQGPFLTRTSSSRRVAADATESPTKKNNWQVKNNKGEDDDGDPSTSHIRDNSPATPPLGVNTPLSKIHAADLVNGTLASTMMMVREHDTRPPATLQNSSLHPVHKATSPKYRILCTTMPSKHSYGSYMIRCKELSRPVHDFFGNDAVEVYTIPLDAARRRSKNYNATIVVKMRSIPRNFKRRGMSYGTIYVDIIDAYKLKNATIPKDHHPIVQNSLHQYEIFGNRSNVHVIPHWFNSFPADMLSDDPILPPPSLTATFLEETESSTPLSLGMIWDPWPQDKEHAESIIELPESGYRLEPVVASFHIRQWLQECLGQSTIFNELSGQNKSIEEIVDDIDHRGQPLLYQLIFRRFDVLLVLGKVSMEYKLRYNSVQRAVSQM